MNKNDEIRRLEKIAKKFSMLEGVNGRVEKFRVDTVRKHLKGKTVLDVGCADGVMASSLVDKYKVTGIDGSEKLIKRAQKITPDAEFIFTLFEDFKPKQKYDNVVLSFILEHVEDPVLLLKYARKWVKDNGNIIVLVPNAQSLHRRVGVSLGLLNDIHDLNLTDLAQGHRRVYGFDLLLEDIRKANLKVSKKGGYFLKFLSEAQMVGWSDDLLQAFYDVSKSVEDRMCMEIFAVCQKNP